MNAFDDSLSQEIAPLLASLTEHLRAGTVDVKAHRMLLRLREAFPLALASHSEWLMTALFPALYESMAGSDAVCIRDMEGGLCEGHRSLSAQWHALEPMLGKDASPPSDAGALLAHLEPLAALYARQAAFEQDELFPMAERLLSDEVLAHLRA
ncbi:MAG: hemerythrin domain-containing protein [Variovorax sp.]|nr:hemerythrin domain-containing protein [Variovorax sp.]